MKLKICIVDDEKTFVTILKQSLKQQGHDVSVAYNAEDALEIILEGNFDLVILDLNLPNMSGLEALQQLRKYRDDCDVVVVTAHGSIEYTVKAMRLGAVDLITKPLQMDTLKIVLDRIIKRKELIKEVYIHRASGRTVDQTGYILGHTESMKKLHDMAFEIAKNATTSVLIQGETGSGKGFLAQFIHDKSPKSKQPMLQFNCAAVPDTLIESELFGFQAGAFSGAQKTKKGLLEIADGGMLFLDEIGDMSLAAQSKLLQVIENKRFKRIGGLSDISSDLWIVAATNKDLETESEKGLFRKDLLYRLNVLTLTIPPLRDRKKDIPLYINHFIDKFGL
ncbi:sigma-54 dependent transcriptional regulator, partial [bacterium]|nr:sigma-54 dependent transcriptional regulator [bacterium]